MKIRLARPLIDALLKAHLTYAVVIMKDVSVVVPGAVEAAFSHLADAQREASRLCHLYGVDQAFFAVDLRSATCWED